MSLPRVPAFQAGAPVIRRRKIPCIEESGHALHFVDDHQGRCALQVLRPSGRRPFVVLVAPLRLPDRTLGLDPPKAIAFVTDPERTPESLADVLARLYGLTPTESKVTAQLLAGASVAELAERLEISEYTVRTHLKRIFDKLGVRSQAELVRVLLSGVAALQSSKRLPSP